VVEFTTIPNGDVPTGITPADVAAAACDTGILGIADAWTFGVANAGLFGVADAGRAPTARKPASTQVPAKIRARLVRRPVICSTSRSSLTCAKLHLTSGPIATAGC
jgi:hypothetical protein